MKKDREYVDGIRLKLKMWNLMEKLGLENKGDLWWLKDEDCEVVVGLHPHHCSSQIAALGHKQTWIEKI